MFENLKTKQTYRLLVPQMISLVLIFFSCSHSSAEFLDSRDQECLEKLSENNLGPFKKVQEDYAFFDFKGSLPFINRNFKLGFTAQEERIYQAHKIAGVVRLTGQLVLVCLKTYELSCNASQKQCIQQMDTGMSQCLKEVTLHFSNDYKYQVYSIISAHITYHNAKINVPKEKLHSVYNSCRDVSSSLEKALAELLQKNVSF